MEYRPKVQSPWGLPTSAERLAIACAIGTVHRELSNDESLIAVAIAGMFADEIRRVDRENDGLRHQLHDCQARVMDLVRNMGA